MDKKKLIAAAVAPTLALPVLAALAIPAASSDDENKGDWIGSWYSDVGGNSGFWYSDSEGDLSGLWD